MTSIGSIEISVNGRRLQVPEDSSVLGVLGVLKIAGDRVAVELNKSIVRKRDWDLTPVTGGAQLEIVEFVGGG